MVVFAEIILLLPLYVRVKSRLDPFYIKAIKEGKKDLAEIYETIKPQGEDEAKRLNVRQTPGLNPGADKIKGRFSLRN